MRARHAERKNDTLKAQPQSLDQHHGKRPRGMRGQAMVEYVLIAALVSIAIGAAIELTGPAIGNVFSNTVYGVLGYTTTPYSTLTSGQINHYQTAVASFTYSAFSSSFNTNTPPAATCSSNPGFWATINGNATNMPPTYAVNC